MITARFIHTVVNGKEELLSTSNLDETLCEKNLLPLLSSNRDGEQIFFDDNAITNTTITPDSEPNGRQYTTTDSIIIKFTDKELVSYLKPAEKQSLIRRINNKLGLIARMQQAQNSSPILVNPLPEVKI